VRGAEGTQEKDITLAVARRLKAAVEARLGIRVVMTREDDRGVPMNERTALANNNKADLFISVHANASVAASVSGAQVFYLALDPEMEEAVRAAEAESLTLPVLGGGSRLIEVVRWDMAQARHLSASEALGRILEETLRTRIPLGPRPIQQAPLRVLVGANMPAALIEMGYLTNESDARKIADSDFQTAVAQAIYEAVVRFRPQIEGTQ